MSRGDEARDPFGQWAVLMRVLADERTEPLWPLIDLVTDRPHDVRAAAREYLTGYEGFDAVRWDLPQFRESILAGLQEKVGKDVVGHLRNLERMALTTDADLGGLGARAVRELAYNASWHAAPVPLVPAKIHAIVEAVGRTMSKNGPEEVLTLAEESARSAYIEKMEGELSQFVDEYSVLDALRSMIKAVELDKVRQLVGDIVSDDDIRALVDWSMT